MNIETVKIEGNYLKLKQFIDSIRKLNSSDVNEFNKLFYEKWEEQKHIIKDEINQYTIYLLQNAFFVNAFAEYGINGNNGFFSEIIAKLKHKILPIALPEEELSHFIGHLFEENKDYEWLNKISLNNWQLIFSNIENIDSKVHQKLQIQICNSLTILCNRLTTMGIDPSLSAKFPTIDDLGSPFFNLHNQIDIAIKNSTALISEGVDEKLFDQIKLSIAEIESLFVTIQEDIKESGTSLNLIFLLKRAQQHIKRIKLLTLILLNKNKNEFSIYTSKLIVELVEAEQLKNNINHFFRAHTQLLAYRIVSHTSKKGEDYIGFSKKENKALFRSAMGGGLIVVVLVFIKHFIHQLHFSLFFEGLLFGLNYGLGFVAMHLLHFTLATKQPALTASYIAENIGQKDKVNSKSSNVFIQIIRSQLVSLMGNLVVVIPICFIISFLFLELWNTNIFSDNQAKNALLSNHLFYSLSLFYALITGILLSLSGIVTGYIDNKVIYSHIALRIENHPKIMKKYPLEKRKKIAAFFEKNLGAIIGNLFLGFSLGMAGNFGEFIGIPYDIRHITISAGNFSIALVNMHWQDLAFVLTVFTTVILIGFINIIVSFLISFILACSSRGLSWKQSIKLIFNRN